MIKRIWAFLTGGTPVWLKDFDGTVTLTIARTDAWGDIWAERHWPFEIHKIQLLPDGTCKQKNGTYVDFWKEA